MFFLAVRKKSLASAKWEEPWIGDGSSYQELHRHRPQIEKISDGKICEIYGGFIWKKKSNISPEVRSFCWIFICCQLCQQQLKTFERYTLDAAWFFWVAGKPLCQLASAGGLSPWTNGSFPSEHSSRSPIPSIENCFTPRKGCQSAFMLHNQQKVCS